MLNHTMDGGTSAHSSPIARGHSQDGQHRPHSHGRRYWAVLLAAVATLAAGACAPDPPLPTDPTGPDPSDAPLAAEAAYVRRGPYEVGVTTLTVGDRSAEVWYPAEVATALSAPFDEYHIRDFVPTWLDELIPAEVDPPFVTAARRDVPASTESGPFPLVVFSHGLASFRLQSTTLTSHLASWGFVVVSPEYLERGLKGILLEGPAEPKSDLDVATDAIDAVRAASDSTGGLLSGLVRPGDIYPIGHSAGGLTSMQLLHRDDAHSAIAISMGSIPIPLVAAGTAPPADKSVMYVGGQQDAVVPVEWLRTAYDYAPGQKKLFEMSVAGHINGFTDLCDIGDGGVAGLARATGLPIPDFLLAIGDDGCPTPPNTPNSVLAPQVAHLLTAELRFRSSVDPEPVGLGDQVLASLPAVAAYRHAP